MLTELRIKNFAIIESLTLPLGPGFNVLTGETGAGKSIIVGALALLLGERGGADLVRTGSDKATVEGVFDIAGRDDVRALLDEKGIDTDEPLVVLRREVGSNGRTRGWVNGSTVTATGLAEIGRRLVDLHGQHEAQSLIDAESQRAVLDAFAGARDDVTRVAIAFDALSAVRREIADLTKRRADAERRADYLRHVAREIEDARLVPGEDARLEEEANRLENAEEIRASAASFLALVEDDEAGIMARLAQAGRVLQQLQRYDATLARVQDAFDAGYYSLESVARDLSEYSRTIDLDPSRLETVRRRRDLLFRMVKKYGPTLNDAITVGIDARRELELIDTAGLDLRELQNRETQAGDTLSQSAAALTIRRRDAAQRLARAVEEILPDLGIPDGRFVVELTTREAIGPTGAEDVEFRVALNVGHDVRALSRVASGGELSRVMLALKTILARLDRVPTLVFDEVDAGIGGRVALQVGDTLRRVATSHQVFAITHLPQIAARAHQHILVTKGAKSGVTTADVVALSADDRVREIARMLGGDPESETSRAHAAELLAAGREAASPPAPVRARRHA